RVSIELRVHAETKHMTPPPRIRERADYGGDAPHIVRCLFVIGLGVMAPEKHQMSRLSINRPLIRPAATLSPPCGERAGRGVPIWFMVPMHAEKRKGALHEPRGRGLIKSGAEPARFLASPQRNGLEARRKKWNAWRDENR